MFPLQTKFFHPGVWNENRAADEKAALVKKMGRASMQHSSSSMGAGTKDESQANRRPRVNRSKPLSEKAILHQQFSALVFWRDRRGLSPQPAFKLSASQIRFLAPR